MGNIHSAARRHLGLYEDPGFASLIGQLASPQTLPTCWDELHDWAEDASGIFQMYLRIRNCEKEHSPGADEIQFIPFVFSEKSEDVYNLPSIEWLDRARFYADNVVVAVMAPDQPPGLITVGRFVHLYMILSRYSDLLVLLKAEYPAADKLTDDCMICLDHDQNMIVLSCSHKLCSKCSKRWVSRRLQCPFCRHGFSRNEVRKNQWEMLEWQSQDVEKDVVMFQQRLEEFWAEVDMSLASENLLQGYISKGRNISQILDDEEGDLVIVA